MTYLPYTGNLKPYARQLRRDMTPSESMLWHHIRKKQILNIQFYRQKIISSYIADFFAPAVKLIIEIDGNHHHMLDNAQYDSVRDMDLKAMGLFVMRFDNWQINANLDSVLKSIHNYASKYKFIENTR